MWRPCGAHIVGTGGGVPPPTMYYYGGVPGPARRGSTGGYPLHNTYYGGVPPPTPKTGTAAAAGGGTPPQAIIIRIQYQSKTTLRYMAFGIKGIQAIGCCFLFSAEGIPPPQNIPIPTPASVHPLGDTSGCLQAAWGFGRCRCHTASIAESMFFISL